MSESPDSDEVRFACIGCGTFNPPGAEVCAGCNHRFAGQDLVPKVRIVMPPRPLKNLYEPPKASIASRPTFQIGSLLCWIAVIAVCLGGFREHVGVGVIAILSVLVPSFWTSYRAGERRRSGNQMQLEDRVWTFLMAFIATWSITVAVVIGFFVSCFGVGLATSSIGLGLVSGGLVAIVVLVLLIRVCLRNSREGIHWEIRDHTQSPR